MMIYESPKSNIETGADKANSSVDFSNHLFPIVMNAIGFVFFILIFVVVLLAGPESSRSFDKQSIYGMVIVFGFLIFTSGMSAVGLFRKSNISFRILSLMLNALCILIFLFALVGSFSAEKIEIGDSFNVSISQLLATVLLVVPQTVNMIYTIKAIKAKA